MEYDINIIFAFVGVGVVLLLGGGGSPVWGYTWLSLSLMALLFTVISQLIINGRNQKESRDKGWLGLARTVWTYAVATMPVSLMFILVAWYTAQYVRHQDIIKRGNLPQEYYAFSNASVVLLVFEVIALYNMVGDIMKEGSMSRSAAPPTEQQKAKRSLLEQMQTKDETIYYGFMIFNFIMAGFMHVILTCFITDG